MVLTRVCVPETPHAYPCWPAPAGQRRRGVLGQLSEQLGPVSTALPVFRDLFNGYPILTGFVGHTAHELPVRPLRDLLVGLASKIYSVLDVAHIAHGKARYPPALKGGALQRISVMVAQSATIKRHIVRQGMRRTNVAYGQRMGYSVVAGRQAP